MRATSSPEHGRPPTVRIVEDADEYRVEAAFCCERAKKHAVRTLRNEADST